MSSAQTLPPPPRRTSNVLVIDDDPQRAARTADVLRHDDLEVDVSSSGDGLLDQVQRDQPDALVLTIPLASGDWVELCGDLRTLDQARLVPIVLLSTEVADEATVVRGLSCGADDFVVDLQRNEELKARVRVQLRHRRDRELLQWASAQRARFRTEALVDPLTGVGNRRAAEEGLGRAIEGSEPFVLLMVDVDHFKRVNDTYGHAVGDLALKGIADCLDQLARRGDVVARYGGEEFLLVLRGAKPSMAHRVAQRFRRTVGDLAFPDAPGVGAITVSIGVATCLGNGATPSAADLLQAADYALYEAKRAGRNRVVVTHLDKPSGDSRVA